MDSDIVVLIPPDTRIMGQGGSVSKAREQGLGDGEFVVSVDGSDLLYGGEIIRLPLLTYSYYTRPKDLSLHILNFCNSTQASLTAPWSST